MPDRILLEGLTVRAGERALVSGVSLTLTPGEVVALVGPSGSGKSLTLRALLGLVRCAPGVTAADLRITADGREHRPWEEVLARGASVDRAFAPVRGRVLSLVPQDPAAALDPLETVATQVRRAGRGDDPAPWLEAAGLDPSVGGLHPHALSGGMAQRVVIAQALATRSPFLLADEPTSALDPLLSRAVLGRLRSVVQERGLGLLWVTHDLRAIPGMADRVVALVDGRVVERFQVADLVAGHLQHPSVVAMAEATRHIAAGRLG